MTQPDRMPLLTDVERLELAAETAAQVMIEQPELRPGLVSQEVKRRTAVGADVARLATPGFFDQER